MADTFRNIEQLAVVLKHANSAPPQAELARETFYALKQKLCEQYGECVGEDAQHIVKMCNACGGTGIWYSVYDEDQDHGELCNRCIKGVYLEKWVILQRWRIGTSQIFHRPLSTTTGPFTPTGNRNVIEGIIRHKPSKMARACQKVLAIVFAGMLSAGDYWELFTNTEAELRRYKAVMSYLFCVPRASWPRVMFRFADLEKRIREASVPW